MSDGTDAPHKPQPHPDGVESRIAYIGAMGSGSWQEMGVSTQGGVSGSPVEPTTAQVRQLRDLQEWLKGCLNAHNLIVLAGSGTSLQAGVGGPSMADLWAECRTLAAFDQVVKLVKQPADDTWIENLLSRCRAAMEFLEPEQAAVVSDFLGHAERQIWNRCRGVHASASLEIHRTFLRRMARRRTRAPRLRIFTTNYDLCFEAAAGELGLVVIDGFSFSSPRRFDPRFFSCDLVRRSAEADESNEFVEGVIHLLKLHGSVNWDDLGDAIVQAEAPAHPCLVFPAISKYQRSYTQPHLELMARYLAALREPNTCFVVVGFGFHDDHLTAPISAAMEGNPGLRLLVVDRCAREKATDERSFCGRLAKRLGESAESGFMLLNATFAEFVNLIPDLKALSPAEQLERSVKQMVGKG